jgi:hypothetical protein
MEEAKKEIDKTKKGMFGVVAFFLCVFFFMLPFVQFTQNTAGDNMLMVSKGGSLDLEAGESGLSWSVSSAGDGSGPVSERTTVAASTTAKNSFTLRVDPNETAPILYVIVKANEYNVVDTKPIKVVQVMDIALNSGRAASGWKMATGGIMDGKTPGEKEEGLAVGVNIKPNFLVFVFLLIPLMLIGILFTKFSFTFLRNISIIGPIAVIAFIIMVNKQYVFYTPTIFSWIILILYIGLFAFMQYCHISEKNWNKTKVGA